MKMNMDGSVRAKCLQYKKNGNELTEKWQTLKKYADGIFFAEETDEWGRADYRLYFEENGVIWFIGYVRPIHLDMKREEIENMRANFFDKVQNDAKEGEYIRLLEIEVFRRLGHDVAPLLTARSEYLKKQEENRETKQEEQERKEREKAEQEAREKAEKIADGVRKMQEKRGEISTDTVELIAGKYGVSIHGRTLGMMREKSVAVVYMNDKIYFRGYKLTRANANTLGAIIDEILEKIAA